LIAETGKFGEEDGTKLAMRQVRKGAISAVGSARLAGGTRRFWGATFGGGEG